MLAGRAGHRLGHHADLYEPCSPAALAFVDAEDDATLTAEQAPDLAAPFATEDRHRLVAGAKLGACKGGKKFELLWIATGGSCHAEVHQRRTAPYVPQGSSSTNVDPTLCPLSTRIEPPCASAILRQMYRPSPSPP
jgi:hypothetical protein